MPANQYRMDPVFLLSPGRSGNTLLQRYLNCSEELIIWGEHGGLLSGFRNAYNRWIDQVDTQKMLAHYSSHTALLLKSEAAVGVDIEWTNNFTKTDLQIALRNLITELFTKDVQPDVRWGLKEIRYTYLDIEFFKNLFPDSQFIFIVRDPINTLISALGAWTTIGNFWNEESLIYKKQELIQEEIDKKVNHLQTIAEGIIKSIAIDVGTLTNV